MKLNEKKQVVGDEQTLVESNKKSRLFAASAIIALVVAVCALWVFVFSPQAQIKEELKKLILSVEQMDAETTMGYLSDDYYDEAGFDKSGIRWIAELAFSHIDKIKIKTQQIKIEVKGARAEATVTGVIVATVGDSPIKSEFTSEPLKLGYVRELGGWKIDAISGMNWSVVEDIESYWN